ncbi:hypothetical protein VE01_00859 [Pseudogymnoascus verrucosus]|uniref:PXA domain-containing protein n=1 Tax=Pseudogymnoascus verrucosus TaxID=342668 RepID=A0A2P2SW74_9PEZI|nr:uncharacterized protein VE01_00859 [Pseudogymnoascus verrucosus]OBU01098.1 hypothetical protein VE01_00859 [Pseudogymnoascus verrucosus]
MAPSRTTALLPQPSSNTSIKPTRATPSPALRAPQPTQAQLLAALSPAATSALIRRTLHPTASKDTPLSALLKPLTGDKDVDFEIYALLAVVMREFVVKWYGNITGDPGFVGEIGELVEGVVRKGWGRLGERKRENGGWGGVVVEIGGVVGEVGRGHVDAYRTAHTTHLPSPFVASPRNIYHALHPHPALSPVPDPTDPASIELQSANDAAYRELLARRLLHTLLPPTERDNPALMALVGSILADLVIEKAVERACESGVIWEGIAKVVEGVAARGKSARRVDRGDDGSTRKGGWQATFWMVIQFAFLAFTAVRALVIAVATSSSLPRRGVRLSKSTTSPTTATGPTPVLGMKMWSFLARQVELEERMPWAYGALALGQWVMLYGPGRVGAVDGVVDRLLTHFLLGLLPPAAPTLRALRGLLFPLNAPSPPGAPMPVGEEAARMRRRAAEGVVGLVPRWMGGVYFGSGKAKVKGGREEEFEGVERMLGVWGDAWMNRCFVYSLLEAGVVGLLPELAGGKGIVGGADVVEIAV